MSVVVKIGPWGKEPDDEGEECDIASAPLRLENIQVHHGDVVNALTFSYKDCNRHLEAAGPWGRTTGEEAKVTLGPAEFVVEVQGKYGLYNGNNAIASLTFSTNLKTYGPFGGYHTPAWKGFSVPVKNNSSIVGFFGRTNSSHISAIGVYIKPF